MKQKLIGCFLCAITALTFGGLHTNTAQSEEIIMSSMSVDFGHIVEDFDATAIKTDIWQETLIASELVEILVEEMYFVGNMLRYVVRVSPKDPDITLYSISLLDDDAISHAGQALAISLGTELETFGENSVTMLLDMRHEEGDILYCFGNMVSPTQVEANAIIEIYAFVAEMDKRVLHEVKIAFSVEQTGTPTEFTYPIDIAVGSYALQSITLSLAPLEFQVTIAYEYEGEAEEKEAQFVLYNGDFVVSYVFFQEDALRTDHYALNLITSPIAEVPDEVSIYVFEWDQLISLDTKSGAVMMK